MQKRADEILDAMREVQSEMTRNRDVEQAAELGARLADLVKELDGILTAGQPLPQAWEKRGSGE